MEKHEWVAIVIICTGLVFLTTASHFSSAYFPFREKSSPKVLGLEHSEETQGMKEQKNSEEKSSEKLNERPNKRLKGRQKK